MTKSLLLFDHDGNIGCLQCGVVLYTRRSESKDEDDLRDYVQAALDDDKADDLAAHMMEEHPVEFDMAFDT